MTRSPTKKAANAALRYHMQLWHLALASLEARVLLVDDINAATTTNDTVCAVTSLEGLQRISDFHFSFPIKLILPRQNSGVTSLLLRALPIHVQQNNAPAIKRTRCLGRVIGGNGGNVKLIGMGELRCQQCGQSGLCTALKHKVVLVEVADHDVLQDDHVAIAEVDDRV